MCPPSTATVIDARGEEPVFTDGPFLETKEFLAGYHAYHVARADLLRRLGRSQESRAVYSKAIELAANGAEIAYLRRRRDEL